MSRILKPNQIVDQYKVEQLEGQDELREQYTAYEIETGEPVSLVVLEETYTEEGQFAQDYLQRTQSLTQIRHANLIKCLSTGLTDGHPFMSMEPVNGFTLSERLRRLSQTKASTHTVYSLTLVQQMASGLALVERLDLFHYELTPEHVLLRSVTLQGEDTVIVTDLDIPHAYSRDPGAYSDAAAAYLSPEQLAGNDIDGRSHVYSLGVMLYELLCGELPERPNTPWDRLWSTFRGKSALQQVRPDLSLETYALVERAIHRNRRLRHSSVAAFHSALAHALEEEVDPVRAEPSESAREPRPVFLIPLFMFFLCGLLGILSYWLVPGLQDGEQSSVVIAALAPDDETAREAANPAASEERPSPAASAVSGSAAAFKENRQTTQDPEQETEVPISEPFATSTPTATSTRLPQISPTVEPSATPEPSAAAPATSSPNDTPAPTPEPEAAFRVAASSANLRLGPGTLFDPVGFVYRGEDLAVLGRNDGDYIWLNVQTADGRRGWVAADVGELVWPVDLAEVELAATLPPAPTATFTSLPTASPIPPTPLPPTQLSGGGDNGGSGGGGGNDQPRATPTPPL
jgi:serine/threonine protein kinase